MNNDIYTWVGSNKTILLSINPFQNLPLYTPELIQLHSHPPPNKPLPPHVYDIAYSAYQELVTEGTDQSILISGESGAGKTEATKQCLGFIAEIAGSDSSLEQRILETNPILEAFGNAKTVRNNNSSRFGKWIEVHFDDNGKVCGASIESYLLEKSRVVNQQKDERNFHIFYQLFTSNEIKQKYGLTSPADYRYLTAGNCLSVKGIDDAKDFVDVNKCFEQLNFSEGERNDIFDILVAIMLLGNLDIYESDPDAMHPVTKVKNIEILQAAADLLHIPKAKLEEAVCTRRISVKEGFSDTITIIPLSAHEARQNCDALAKELYSRVFDWIVVKINESLNGERNKFIGFLDIFGFEIFQLNSFEQLCINYANERLQQLFNMSTFKEEETVYKNEGIKFQHIEFIDNKEVLEMLENRYGGLFCAIDDQVRMRNGTDENLLKNIRNTLTKYKCFDPSARAPLEFGVTHYAGKVNYQITGFTDKNRDRIFDNLYDLVHNSESPFISSLFPTMTSSAMKQTVCSKFQKQLNDLVSILQTSQRKYIRCIKPNDQKRKLLFENTHSLEQMRYSGIFEAVKIRKLGYPFRLTHQQFVHRYRCLPMSKQITVNSRLPIQQQIQAILSTRPEIKDEIYIGRTLVLYKAPEHRILELARNLALDELLPALQSAFKRKIAMVGLPLYIRVTTEITAALQTKSLDTIQAAIQANENDAVNAQQLLQRSLPILKKAESAVIFLKKMSTLEQQVRTLLSGPLSSNMNTLMQLIEEVEQQADLAPPSILQLIQEAKQRVQQFAASLIEPDLREALYSLERSEMQRIVEQAHRLSYSSESVKEAERLLGLSEEEFFKLEIERAEQLGDMSRLIDRKTKLRDLLLQKNKATYAFTSYPSLKSAEEYASYKILTMNRKWWRQTAYSYINLLIPTCLTNLPKDRDKSGTLLFKTIQGFMKDRKYNMNSEQLAFEILKTVNKHDCALRTEVYCQLIKQLTENPSPASVALGDDLMAILLYYCLPTDDFLSYLIVYIWDHFEDSDKYIHLLNNSYFSSKFKLSSSYNNGVRNMPANPEEIESFLNSFKMNSCHLSIDDKSSFSRPSTISDTSSRMSQSRGTLVQRGSTSRASVMIVNDGTIKANKAPMPPAPAPPLPARPKKETAIVLYDITLAINENVLVCSEGDCITIEEDCGDWLRASLNGKEGYVPYNYIQRQQ